MGIGALPPREGHGDTHMYDLVNLVNLTPHEITLHVGGHVVRIPPSGKVARLEEELTDLPPVLFDEYGDEGVVHRIPRQRALHGKITDLPEPEKGVVFIASMPVAQVAARQGRKDVLSPGKLVRDDAGRIVGCEGLRAW